MPGMCGCVDEWFVCTQTVRTTGVPVARECPKNHDRIKETFADTIIEPRRIDSICFRCGQVYE